MTYVIAEPRIDVKDKACIQECPVERICEGERMLYIHPGECAGWGACEPVRAVEAIFYKDDVPGQWAQFTVGNAKFFDQLGSPGGAAKTGPLPYDTEYVANYVVERWPVVSWPSSGGAAARTLTQRPVPRQRKRPRRPPCEQDPARRLRLRSALPGASRPAWEQVTGVRYRLEVRLTPADVGQRVVIRWRRPSPGDGEQIADVLGILEENDSTSFAVRTSDGALVVIPAARAITRP